MVRRPPPPATPPRPAANVFSVRKKRANMKLGPAIGLAFTGLHVGGKGTIESINGTPVRSKAELMSAWDALADGMVRLTFR